MSDAPKNDELAAYAEESNEREEEDRAVPGPLKESEPELMSVAIGSGPSCQNVGMIPGGPFVMPGLPSTHIKQPKPFSGPVREEKNETKSEGWIVESSTLSQVPFDFPLEKTSRRISAVSEVVSTRISNCLRERSIDAKFSKKKAMAKCCTLEYVHFRIRLFIPHDGDGNKETIVEVQRRRGDSIDFLKHCHAVLNAAEGDGAAPATETVPIHIQQPISEMACVKALEEKLRQKDFEEMLAEAIENAVELIRKEELDLNVLGFESLVSLVDPSSTLPAVAHNACKKIVAHDSQDDSASEIRGAIAALLKNGALHREDSAKFGEPEAIVSDFNANLKNQALCLLSKIFEDLHKEGNLTTAVQENNDWFVDTLIPPIIEAVKTASDRPHDAYYAALCLSHLMSSSDDIKVRAEEEDDALGVLQAAQKYGRAHHSNLAEAADRGIALLGC